jgi:hypothetical protein
MKRILYIAAATVAVCLMTTASHAQAENLKLRFHIPFAFTVENTTFPAGDYEVTAPAHLLLEVRNIGSQAAAFKHATPAQSNKEADGRTKLTFHVYGGEYFLTAVSDGSYRSTYDLRLSKEEKRLADASPRPQLKVVNVLASSALKPAGDGRE